MRARPLFVVTVVALLLGTLAAPQAAVAAAKRPTVTVKTSSTTVPVSSAVTMTGRVSGTSSGATVRLQRRAGGTWKTVTSSKVKRSRTYRLTTTITQASTRFRVRVARTTKLRAASSRTVTVTGTPASASTPQSLILRETNEFRAANGKPPLASMPALDAVAQQWSEHMASSGDFAHRPDFTSAYPAGWTRAGENIAAGQTPEDVVDAWIDSPGHRANLLGDFTCLGVGYATGGPYGRYYTQNFARYSRC